MKMALDAADGLNVVRSYAPGRVRVGGTDYTESLIVLPRQIVTEWRADTAVGLRASDLSPIAELSPEVVIFGTGETQRFPDPGQLVLLIDLGIGFEVMDNAAACRTFNILLGEGRHAALALMLT